MIKTPLSGHTSQETAYLVDDYPYGFKLRCKIRYWLEYRTNKGYRFCSQTTNPKKPIEVWNAPKKSTYVEMGASMYLDENDYVQWTGLGRYATTETVAAFRQNFPDAKVGYPVH